MGNFELDLSIETIADAQVTEGVNTGSHSQNTDTHLATGTADEVSANELRAELDTSRYTQSQVDTLLDDKESTLTAGTTAQYYRGDKTWQTLDKTAAGLGNVDNTSDVNKPISTATQTALDNKVDTTALNSYQLLTGKDSASGYAGLDASSKINPSQLPAIAITNTFVVASQVAQLALSAETGDVAVRTDENKSYILQGADPSVLGDWQELLSPTDAVSSVFSRAGTVTAQSGDYTATQITNTPAGDIAAVTVQAAITELDSEKASNTSVSTHTGDATIHYTQASIDHVNILNKGTNTHTEIDTHLADTNDDHTQYHNNTRGDIRYYTKTQSDTALDGKVDENVAITGATKTKITYDAKGLVTAGGDLIEADIPTLSQGKITDLTTDLNSKANKTNVLELDNTTPFTPDADHEPSTKKYVDDNSHSHTNKTELDLVTDGDHDVRVDNPHTTTASHVGLGNVDNTSDANKPVSTAQQTALDNKADKTNVLELDNTSAFTPDADYEPAPKKYVDDSISTAGHTHINKTQLDLITDGDHDVRTDNPHTVTKTHVGLGSVDNTSDASKPVSTATQTALDGKESTLTAGTTAQYYRGDKTWQTLDKTAAGLGNVDNTSDLNKPISTAQQTALDGKVAKITSTDHAIPRFNGVTGDIQDSGAIIDDDGNLFITGGGVVTGRSALFQSGTELYQGIGLKSNKDTSSAVGYSYIDAQNNLGVVDTAFITAHNTDGSSSVDISITPAGDRTTARRFSALKVLGNGNVGIGTNTPTYLLDVKGSGAGRVLVGGWAGGAFGMVTLNNDIGAGANFYSSTTDKSLYINRPDAASIKFRKNNADQAELNTSGQLGLGVFGGSIAHQLHLSTDSAGKPTSNVWTITSDERIKTDIQDFTDGLNVIENMRPVTYKYNGKGGFAVDGKDNISIIAQELQEIAPYMVGKVKTKLNPDDVEDTELLNYEGHALAFVLVNAIKEQQQMIRELQDTVKTLKRRKK